MDRSAIRRDGWRVSEGIASRAERRRAVSERALLSRMRVNLGTGDMTGERRLHHSHHSGFCPVAASAAAAQATLAKSLGDLGQVLGLGQGRLGGGQTVTRGIRPYAPCQCIV